MYKKTYLEKITDELRDLLPKYADEMLMPSPAGGKDHYICPICGSGTGPNGTGAFSVYYNKEQGRMKWRCFSCRNSGDIFDLCGILNPNLTAFPARRKDIAAWAGVDLPDEITPDKRKALPLPARTKTAAAQKAAHEPEQDYTAFYAECEKHLAETSYHRGIGIETLKRYHVGYAPAWRHPKAPAAVPTSPRLIIPVTRGAYLARDTRAEKDIPEGAKGYKKQKIGGVHIYNSAALYADDGRPLVVVEGELDALSVIDAGGDAIALGSTANTSALLDLLKEKPTKRPLVLALDNDAAGKKAGKELEKRLQEQGGILFLSAANLAGSKCKDANERLQTDSAGLAKAVKKVMDMKPEDFPENPVKEKAETGAAAAAAAGLFDWPDLLESGKYLKPDIESARNIEVVLKKMGVTCRLNDINHRRTISINGGQERPLNDSAEIRITQAARKMGLLTHRPLVSDALQVIAENHRYNPAVDFLDLCRATWDGEKTHIKALFDSIDLKPNTDANPDFLFTLFRKWMIQCARMAGNDGDLSAAGVLVFCGRQGAGKSRFLQTLLPGRYFRELGRPSCWCDPRSKDSVEIAAGTWIAELCELDGFLKRRNSADLKNFLTSQSDTFRKSYGHHPETYPRRTSFYATTNSVSFLKDESGCRRFWVVPVVNFKPVKEEVVYQAWGEAKAAADEKEMYWLTDTELTLLGTGQEDFQDKTDEEIIINESLDWQADEAAWQYMTATELCMKLGIALNRVSFVGRVLKRLETDGKIELCKNRHSGRRYKLPPSIKTDAERMFSMK